MTLTIEIIAEPTKDFVELVNIHTEFCDRTAPAESCHRLPVDELFTPDVMIWTISEGDLLLGMGGLKELSKTDGEIKSMHVKAAARGKGAARMMLATIIAEAQSRSYRDLWLETGVHPDFTAARKLYETAGFTECAPFGDYVLDPHSVFMTKAL